MKLVKRQKKRFSNKRATPTTNGNLSQWQNFSSVKFWTQKPRSFQKDGLWEDSTNHLLTLLLKSASFLEQKKMENLINILLQRNDDREDWGFCLALDSENQIVIDRVSQSSFVYYNPFDVIWSFYPICFFQRLLSLVLLFIVKRVKIELQISVLISQYRGFLLDSFGA